MKSLSLCITNYNRTDLLLKSFEQVLGDPRISEIIICDDGSNEKTTLWLLFHGTETQQQMEKIKWRLHPNNNVGMYENKKRAVEYASNEWCILFDSDNVLTPAYLDAFESHCAAGIIFPSTVYCPAFAKPQFDYRDFTAMDYITTQEVKENLHKPMFECLLNTCNYIVNRDEYLKVWEPAKDIKAADSIYFIYLWLKSGRDLLVVEGMEYEHRVHEGSGFLQDIDGNMRRAKQVKELIKLI